ncbi:MAG: hypothetical protein P8181_12785 [bacterium]
MCRILAAAALIPALICLAGGCSSDDDGVVKPSDNVAPNAVDDLAASETAPGTLQLVWTAPGDDGDSGTASAYDIRYMDAPLDAGNWSAATQASGEPAPAAAGTQQTFTLTGMSPNTTYYVGLRTKDEAGNLSSLSNVVAITTSNIIAGARAWYVLPDGTGDAPTIQAAVDSAAAGDTVLVAAGTYYEHAIVLKGGILLRGETGDAADVVIDGQQEAGILTCSYQTQLLIIENVTLYNGYAHTESGPSPGSGGFFLSSTVTIRNCRFVDNQGSYGIALLLSRGTIEVSECVFSGNSSGTNPFSGSAVNCVQTDPIISDCLFEDNGGTDANSKGGAIAFSYGQPQVLRCTFVNNGAGSGGAVFCGDGAIATIQDCTFNENHVSGNYRRGGALYTASTGEAVLIDCVFNQNNGGTGGAVCIFSDRSSIDGCTFTTNYSNVDAGALFIGGGAVVTVTGTAFQGNSANGLAGAVQCMSSQASITGCLFTGNTAARGGALDVTIGDPDVAQCTFYSNHCTSTIGATVRISAANPTFTQCILAAGTGGEAVGFATGDTDSAPQFTCCDIFGHGPWITASTRVPPARRANRLAGPWGPKMWDVIRKDHLSCAGGIELPRVDVFVRTGTHFSPVCSRGAVRNACFVHIAR